MHSSQTILRTAPALVLVAVFLLAPAAAVRRRLPDINDMKDSETRAGEEYETLRQQNAQLKQVLAENKFFIERNREYLFQEYKIDETPYEVTID